jgi:hypothetical protein
MNDDARLYRKGYYSRESPKVPSVNLLAVLSLWNRFSQVVIDFNVRLASDLAIAARDVCGWNVMVRGIRQGDLQNNGFADLQSRLRCANTQSEGRRARAVLGGARPGRERR